MLIKALKAIVTKSFNFFSFHSPIRDFLNKNFFFISTSTSENETVFIILPLSAQQVKSRGVNSIVTISDLFNARVQIWHK